jgi:hypothetical protein
MAETERDRDVRDLFARILVIETIQNQLLQRCAVLSGSPQAFLSGVMQSSEETLHQLVRQATPKTAKTAGDAMSSFRDRSMRLIAALTPDGKPQ